MPREDVFLPITVHTPVSIPDIVSIPNSVSIAEVASGISLVPYACDRRISIIRESRETIPLIN